MKYLTPIVFLTLTACPLRPVPFLPSSAEGDSYLASGNEPGWNLIITDKTITYVGDYGETRITVARPALEFTSQGSRYLTEQISVTVEQGPCESTAVDQKYHDKVTIVAHGKTVTGCGGYMLPPEDLKGTSWRITSINGDTSVGETDASLVFEDGKLFATAGCNRIAADYEIRPLSGPFRTSLKTDKIASTKKACSQNIQERENLLIRILSQKDNFIAYGHNGQMQITEVNGRSDRGTMSLTRIF